MLLFKNNQVNFYIHPMLMVGVHFSKNDQEFDIFLLMFHIQIKFYGFYRKNRKNKPTSF
jgi:uncharacterized membrane protein